MLKKRIARQVLTAMALVAVSAMPALAQGYQPYGSQWQQQPRYQQPQPPVPAYRITPRSQQLGGGYDVQGNDGSRSTITPRPQQLGGGYEFRSSDGSRTVCTPRSQQLGGGLDCRQ